MYVKDKPMVFSEVCHSCGGCSLVCPKKAITEKKKPIGILETGDSQTVRVVTGILNPGEASGVPVIREALKKAEGLTIIDCPPGSACSVMESVMDADFCILVAEPTAFGFHNFQMVCQLVSLLGKKSGVVINKQEAPWEPLERFCRDQGLPILARIPYDPQIAAMASDGRIVSREDPGSGKCSPISFIRSEAAYETSFDLKRKGRHRKDHHRGGLHPLCRGKGCGRL